jgi:hypothetical protein
MASWTPIAKIVPGETSLVSAARANELIDAINAIASMRVTPDSAGAMWTMSRTSAELSLAALDKRLHDLEVQLNGDSTANTGTSGNSSTTIDARLTNIESRLAAASATANCSGNSISITFTI